MLFFYFYIISPFGNLLKMLLLLNFLILYNFTSIHFDCLEQTYEYQEGKLVNVGLKIIFSVAWITLLDEVFLVRCIIELTEFKIIFYSSSCKNRNTCFSIFFYQKRMYRLSYCMLIIRTTYIVRLGSLSLPNKLEFNLFKI